VQTSCKVCECERRVKSFVKWLWTVGNVLKESWHVADQDDKASTAINADELLDILKDGGRGQRDQAQSGVVTDEVDFSFDFLTLSHCTMHLLIHSSPLHTHPDGARPQTVSAPTASALILLSQMDSVSCYLTDSSVKQHSDVCFVAAYGARSCGCLQYRYWRSCWRGDTWRSTSHPPTPQQGWAMRSSHTLKAQASAAFDHMLQNAIQGRTGMSFVYDG
jgi:hypothetical protein